MGTKRKEEVDVLAQELPSVFDRKTLPTTWDDDWIVVPINNPDEPHLGESVNSVNIDPVGGELLKSCGNRALV